MANNKKKKKKKQINPKKYEILNQYIRDLASDYMELRDWTTCLDDNFIDDDEEAVATCHCVYGQKYVEISISKSFFGESDEHQKHILVHELVHVHQWGVEECFQNVCGLLSENQYTIGNRAYQLAREYEVDGLASIIAKNAPDIPWEEFYTYRKDF